MGRRRTAVSVTLVASLCIVAVAVVALSSQQRATIYMDYNGTTPIHADALQRYTQLAKDCFGNPSTACHYGKHAKDILEQSRSDIAVLIGAKQGDIVFTSGATESNVLVLRGFARSARLAGKKCVVVTTSIEHASVKNTVDSLAEEGLASVVIVRVDKYGTVDAMHLRELLITACTDAAVIVSVIWINNEIGTMQDVPAIVQVARTACPGVHIHLDGTQTIGRYPVDLANLGVDSVSMSAHKFRGPHGVGALYLPPDKSISAIMTGGKQERDFRGGTENVAACAAMATALQRAHDDMSRGKVLHVSELRTRLLEGLRQNVPSLIVNSPAENCAYNTISVCMPCDSRQMVEHLSREDGICLAVGSACSKGGTSSTLAALGVSESALRGSLRISLGFASTRAECDAVLRAILRYLRTNPC